MHPSYLVYASLRQICLIYSLPVHSVSSRTLYNWRFAGVDSDCIELLFYRLFLAGRITFDAFQDLCLSSGYDFVFPQGVARPDDSHL